MTTLTEYASTEFPNHVVTARNGDVALGDHTAVAVVYDIDDAKAVERQLREQLPQARIAVVDVRTTDPTVVSTGGEDTDSPVDLPKRRVAAAGVGGGIAAGVIAALILGFAWSWGPAILLGVFIAVIAGAASAMAGGGGRYAGERAWEQPNRPGQSITILAALMDDEPAASAAAQVIEHSITSEVRIVSADGAWHSPHT